MDAVKEVTIETIRKLPDNCSFNDIMYEINFMAQVYEGLEDVRHGRTITSDELLNKIKEWEK